MFENCTMYLTPEKLLIVIAKDHEHYYHADVTIAEYRNHQWAIITDKPTKLNSEPMWLYEPATEPFRLGNCYSQEFRGLEPVS